MVSECTSDALFFLRILCFTFGINFRHVESVVMNFAGYALVIGKITKAAVHTKKRMAMKMKRNGKVYLHHLQNAAHDSS